MLPVPVELVALLCRSRPVVSQVLHWPGKERDKLLCKVEEALKGSYGMALKLSKVIAQLPATILGSKHKDSLREIDIVVKGHVPCSNTLASMGPCQARARPLVSMS